MTVTVLLLFLTVPLVGLQYVIVVFLDHTHLHLFSAKSYKNVVQQKGQHTKYILIRSCMIFLGLFRSEKTRFCRYIQGKESLLLGRFFL